MVNPVPGYSVSTGYRKSGPYWTACGWHTGQDYSAPAGTVVVAARAGTVEYVSYGSSFGAHPFAIRPGDGTEDFYAHCSTRPPSGQHVQAGQPVATVGAEGNATGPHLHLERHISYGWGCGLMDDPMKSHDASDDDSDSDDDQQGQGGKDGSTGLEAVGMIVGQHKRTGEIFVWNGTHKLELPVGGGKKSGDGHSAGNTGHVYVDEVLRMIAEAFPGSNPKFAALNPDIMDRTPNA